MIHLCFIVENVFASEFLLKHGAAVDLLTPDGHDSPLHFAATLTTRKLTNVVNLLMNKGANPNLQNNNGW